MLHIGISREEGEARSCHCVQYVIWETCGRSPLEAASTTSDASEINPLMAVSTLSVGASISLPDEVSVPGTPHNIPAASKSGHLADGTTHDASSSLQCCS
mmetsp:Transcript_109369/g.189823  ORF Transcript_109369/g.189823 Transcript_109369/m.189823 type:complete len:100 (-) Transcript_109369:362-661(-)